MEKLGISGEELLKELKAEYHETRQVLANHIKLGSAGTKEANEVNARLDAIRAKIDEVESLLK